LWFVFCNDFFRKWFLRAGFSYHPPPTPSQKRSLHEKFTELGKVFPSATATDRKLITAAEVRAWRFSFIAFFPHVAAELPNLLRLRLPHKLRWLAPCGSRLHRPTQW
jgi:hypothetical protein